MALVTGLTRLIEKELQGIYNPVACAEEVIYNGTINPNSTIEIIIPRIGDLIQELTIKYSYPEHPLNISEAYIETVCTVGSKILLHPNTTSKVSLSYTPKGCDNLRLGGNYEQPGKLWKKHWPLRIFNVDTGLNLICDYEVNLLRPYQITKLILVMENYNTTVTKQVVDSTANITANYIFVDIESRQKLFF